MKERVWSMHCHLRGNCSFEAFDICMNSVSFMHVRKLQHDVSELGVVQEDGCLLLELVEVRSCSFSSVDWLELSSDSFSELVPSGILWLGFNFLIHCSPPHGSMIFQKGPREG